ncbi:MAG: hypothetical protein NTY09_00455 [bacterium]|nr:hypothetical protein [bacterium]
MNAFRLTIIFLVLLVLLAATACSGHKSPTEPDDPMRATENFPQDPYPPFYGYNNETDLAVLVNGPDPLYDSVGDPATIFSSLADTDAHWSVVVSVHQGISFMDPTTIKYAWFDDEYSEDSGPVKVGTLVVVPYFTVILDVKVSACYFYDADSADDSRIVVYTTFVYKPSTISPSDIGIVKSVWHQYQYNDLYFPFSAQTVESPTIFPDSGQYDSTGGADYCPDIAFDPATGDAHVVWTNYYTDGPAPKYFLAYRHGVYYAQNPPVRPEPVWNWDIQNTDQYLLYDDGDPHAMFHPRIDIGSLDGNGYKVGVVYNAYSEYGDNAGWMHIGISQWVPSETDFPDDASYEHLIYAPSGNKQHCMEPRVDIAPESNGDEYTSIVFTTLYDGSYRVVEYNNMRTSNNGFLPLHLSTNYGGVYGAPAIHYDANTVTVTYFVDQSGDNWDLWSTQFALDATAMSGVWGYISAAYGDFAPLDNSSPGVEPGIVNFDNKLWAAWCSYIDGTSTSVVHASYGDPL